MVPSKTSRMLPKLKCVRPNFKIPSKTPHSNSRGKIKKNYLGQKLSVLQAKQQLELYPDSTTKSDLLK